MAKDTKEIKKLEEGSKQGKKEIDEKDKTISKKEIFAVIKTGGKQYKIKDGQEIAIEKIEGKEGDKIIFSEVLLIAADNDIKLGTPFIKDAKVEGNIVSQEKGKKVIVFKMKAKKRYRRTAGHRQEISKVKIVKIIA